MISSLMIISLSALILFVVLFIMICAIFFRRIVEQHKGRKNLVRYKAIEKDVLIALSKKSDLLSTQVARQYSSFPKLLIKVLINYTDTFLGQERHYLRLIFQTSLKSRLSREIGSKFMYKRLRAVGPFVLFSTPEDSSAIYRLLNGCTIKSGRVVSVKMPHKMIERFQIIEYFRAFLGGRLGLSKINCLLIISGAFGLFRKDIAVACGGYRTNSIGEDMDLVIRMKKHLYDKKIPFEMFFIPDPICWTYAPQTLKHLARQRNRWHIGLIDTLNYNSKMLLNPKYGVTGLLAMPFYFIFEMFGPLIELSGYIIFGVFLVTGRINYPFTRMFFIFAFLIGILLSILAVFIEEFSARRFPRLKDIQIIITASILENFFYRQFLTIIRAKAFLNHVMGKKDW